jgi:exosortase
MDLRLALPLLAVGAAAGALYAPLVGGVVRQWYQDPVSSHGILLTAAAIFVTRRRWPALRALPLRPHNLGFVAIAAALLVYTLGTLLGDIFILRITLPLAIAGCVLALAGAAQLRAMTAPLLLLLLAVPLPAIIVTRLTLPLQLIASRVAAGTLQTAGIEVLRAGNLLALKDITLEVAVACSGLNSAVSLIAVASVCGAVMSLSARRTLLLVACAIPIAVFGNGFRVAATGFLVTWLGPIGATGFLHELTGFVAFVAMCAVLLSVQLLARARVRRAVRQPCPVEV